MASQRHQQNNWRWWPSLLVNSAGHRNVPRPTESYAELARDPDVDVVYVGVIHPYHLPSTLLFIQAGKNVLCEKPLGMNSAEVKAVVRAAREKGVFLMEAIWSCFFPASEELCSLLRQGAIRDVMVVHGQFGFPLLTVPRFSEKELGGGGVLDLGVYSVQFDCMVFSGEKPESIVASGFLHDTGVDKMGSIILNFSGSHQAVLTYTLLTKLPTRASISGTKGIIEFPAFFWCPEQLVVNGKSEEFPLLLRPPNLNFFTSAGLRYEAEHIRQCLLQGLKESPVMSHADSKLVHSVLDEVRRQLGLLYPPDQP